MTDRRLTAVWPYCLLWICQILDLVSTAFALSKGDNVESNALPAALIEQGMPGWALGLALKCGAVALLFSIRRRSPAVFNVALLLSGIYMFVIYNNWIVATN